MRDLGLRRLVVWNTGVLAAAQVAVVATQFATTLVLSRYLGPARFGQYTYVFAFYMLFLAISDLGVGTVAVREVSQRRERATEILAGLLSLRILLALAAMAAAWTGVAIFGAPAGLLPSLLLFSLILLFTALQLPLTVLRADLRPGYIAAVGVTSRLVGLGLVLLFVWLRSGVTAMVLAFVASEALFLVVSLSYVRRFIKLGCTIDLPLWRSALGSGVFVGLVSLCAALINRLDFLMLERMTDMTQVGLYAAAYRVTNTAEALPLIIMASVYPLLSRYKNDPERLRRIYQQSLLTLAGLGLSAGIAVTALAPFIVRLLFGGGYEGTTAALRVLIWSSVCVYAFLTSTNLLIGVGRERGLLVLYAIGAALNFLLNLLWIPRFGIVGAALATTASYALVLAGATLAACSVLGRRARACDEPASGHSAETAISIGTSGKS